MNQQLTFTRHSSLLSRGIAALSIALLTHGAHAAVIKTDFSGNPASVVPGTGIGTSLLNVVTGQVTGRSTLDLYGPWDIEAYYFNIQTTRWIPTLWAPLNPAIVGTAGIATPLTFGSVIGASSGFIYSGTITASLPSINYFGFRFQNESTSMLNYGYIVIEQTTPSSSIGYGSLKILGYAYENSGLPITVTPVSEPSTALLMLSGLLGAGGLLRQHSGRCAAGRCQR